MAAAFTLHDLQRLPLISFEPGLRRLLMGAPAPAPTTPLERLPTHPLLDLMTHLISTTHHKLTGRGACRFTCRATARVYGEAGAGYDNNVIEADVAQIHAARGEVPRRVAGGVGQRIAGRRKHRGAGAGHHA